MFKFFRQAASLKVSCIYREVRRFLFCYGKFVDVLNIDTYKINFGVLFDLPYNVSKSVAYTNSKQHLLLMS